MIAEVGILTSMDSRTTMSCQTIAFFDDLRWVIGTWAILEGFWWSADAVPPHAKKTRHHNSISHHPLPPLETCDLLRVRTAIGRLPNGSRPSLSSHGLSQGLQRSSGSTAPLF
ncbi:MAG: hypothetical protein NTW19_15895 [Planctomycetota bacterium]|nr:hypothetical protein [Planctomycetota bacterium]